MDSPENKDGALLGSHVLETVEARLKQKWILPELSFMNNLAASVLWHRLSPVDPPVDLYLPNFSQ